MSSLAALGPVTNDQPAGVTCDVAFSETKNANPNSPTATGTEPYDCEYPDTALEFDCHAGTPSTATDAPNPEISNTENCE